jgi:hypothetical protein
MVGAMRDLILFKQPVNTIVIGGGYETTWEPLIQVACKAEPIRSKRTLQDSQVQLNDAMKFTIRPFTPGFSKSNLIEYLGHDYTINSVENVDQRNRFIEIIAVTNGESPVPIVT